jgi:hypothetical protein
MFVGGAGEPVPRGIGNGFTPVDRQSFAAPGESFRNSMTVFVRY